MQLTPFVARPAGRAVARTPVWLAAFAALAGLAAKPLAAQSFVNHEGPQVHPIALTDQGERLFVLNTPDSRLAIYSTRSPRQPVLEREVFVGLEPVSVRPRTPSEVWVVNWLSDSISVVDVDRGVVTATISVKDEPADVVFAAGKAFVSVSGSDEVRVFDAVTHALLATVPVFGDEPRQLVVRADGRRVWTVVHRSGNDTTILPFDVAPPQPPPTNRRLPSPPQAGLIIDSEDPAWTAQHQVDLPDFDLIEIDTGNLAVVRRYPAVGTINTGAALRPGTDEVWVANNEARNTVRFVTNLRGHAWDSRVTRVRTSGAGQVTPFDLNPGIDYTVLPNPGALTTALAQPQDVVWNAAGTRMYIAAFGTDRIGMADATGRVTGFLEVGNTPGSQTDPRRKRGPRGLALHPTGVLYVLNRLSNSLAVVDPTTATVVAEHGLPDPTPIAVKEGRGFLYDAKLSGNGTFSCASCHVDGDVDGLAWDLGDPGGEMFSIGSGRLRVDLHPMKGPMVTQPLKGLANTGPFHWRGDKTRLADFNGTFDELMGKTELAAADMDALVAYMESVKYPPNPNRTLENELATADAVAGENFYLNTPFRNNLRCVDCHALPTGTNRLVIPGSILDEPQGMKTAQLRNIYKRDSFVATPQGRKGGFGLTHEGSMQDVFGFLGLRVFGPLATNTTLRRQLQAFVLSFTTGTTPATGYQVAVDAGNVGDTAVVAAVQLLQNRAVFGDIDLVVKGILDGEARGWLFDRASRLFVPDRAGDPSQTLAQLSALVRGGRAEVLLTGVAFGTGRRAAIDRDLDGVLDGDEGLRAYGAGSPGCQGVPTLAASSEPRIGNPWFSFVATGAEAQASGYLAVGSAAASLPFLGVTLLVDVTRPDTVVLGVAADGSGRLALPLPLPLDPGLVGVRTFSQIVWADSCASQQLAATPGLDVTISR